jgi:hypothetical protein
MIEHVYFTNFPFRISYTEMYTDTSNSYHNVCPYMFLYDAHGHHTINFGDMVNDGDTIYDLN